MPLRPKLTWRAGALIAACGLLAILAALAWFDSHLPGRDATSRSPAPPPETVELCGFGRTPPIRNTGDYPPAVLATAEQTFSNVAADLASQSAPQTRAVGLYGRLVVAMRQAAQDEQQRAADCTDERCMQRRWKVAKEAAAPHAQELARLATDSLDPAAYGLALYGCRLNRDDGPCAQLSIERWSQLESDNAVPWLHLAGEAEQRGDAAAVRAALVRAARAKSSDAHGSSTLQMALHPAARALPAAPRLVYLSQLLGVYAALPAPPYATVNHACSEKRMAEADRRTLCGELATMLTERGSTLMELALGTTIGERAGWSAERVRRLRDDEDALSFIAQAGWAPEDVHSCRFLEQLEARTNELSALGELPAARKRLAASNRSVTELAQDWRALQRRGEYPPRKSADRD